MCLGKINQKLSAEINWRRLKSALIYCRWINSQRKSASGWGSTVDTMIATEALVAWSARFDNAAAAASSAGTGPISRNDIPNFETGNLVLEVDAASGDVTSGRRTIVVLSSGVETSRVMPLGNVTRPIKVEARGSGHAVVHLSSRHATRKVTPDRRRGDDWKQNNVAINLEPRLEFAGRDSSQIGVLSCQRLKS